MLNPSTADAYQDDATIRRCVSFSQKFGCGGLIVVNLFAFRDKDPQALKKVIDPVGMDNDYAIRQAARRSRHVVAAWGVNAGICGYPRDQNVRLAVALCHKEMMCLGRTSEGFPKHPLYVPAVTKLIPYKRGHDGHLS